MIYAYTRAQAIDDGELVDVTAMPRKSGFNVPVSVTREVWCQFVEWDRKDSDKQTLQDQSGRLWDVLWLLHMACKCSNGEPSLNYKLQVIPCDGRSKSPRLISLKAVIGGGDNGEPIITIMLPNED